MKGQIVTGWVAGGGEGSTRNRGRCVPEVKVRRTTLGQCPGFSGASPARSLDRHGFQLLPAPLYHSISLRVHLKAWEPPDDWPTTGQEKEAPPNPLHG